MISSLAQQLARIHNPEFTAGTGSGRKFADKQRHSLLFSKSEAATKSLDDIYDIARPAFDELVALDARFVVFEDALFSIEAKNCDRVILPQSFNNDLDKALANFLRRLCAHLNCAPGIKCLEWLIRRFRVNEFNVSSVLACALPHYETKVFPVILSVLELEKTPSWSFLSRVVDLAQPMDRVFFLRRMYTDPHIINFFGNFILDCIHSKDDFSSLFTFYTSTCLSFLATVDIITEEIVALLMHYIEHAIFSCHTEWCLSNFLVLCQLCTRTCLSNHVLAKLAADIIESMFNALEGPESTLDRFVGACLSVLNSLSYSQINFPGRTNQEFSDFARLVMHPSFQKCLINAKHSTETLVDCIINCVLAQNNMSALLKMLEFCHETQVLNIFNHLFSNSSNSIQEIQPIFAFLIKSGVYNNQLDIAIKQFLATNTLQHVQQVLDNYLAEFAPIYKVVDSINMSVAFALHSDIENVRKAVSELPKIIESMKEDENLLSTILCALDNFENGLEIIKCASVVDYLVDYRPILFLEKLTRIWDKVSLQTLNVDVTRAVYNACSRLEKIQPSCDFYSHISVLHDFYSKYPSGNLLKHAIKYKTCCTNIDVSLLFRNKKFFAALLYIDSESKARACFADILAVIGNYEPFLTQLACHRACLVTCPLLLEKFIKRFYDLEINAVQPLIKNVIDAFSDAQMAEILAEKLLESLSAPQSVVCRLLYDFSSKITCETNKVSFILHVIPYLASESKNIYNHALRAISIILQSLNKNFVNFNPRKLQEWYQSVVECGIKNSIHFDHLMSELVKHAHLLPDVFLERLLILIGESNVSVFLELHYYFRQKHSMLISSNSQHVAVIIAFVKLIKPSVASQVFRDRAAHDTFKQFLQGHVNQSLEMVQQASLATITPELWSSLDFEQQYELLYILLNIIGKSHVSDVVREAKDVLKRVDLETELVVRFFAEFFASEHTNGLFIKRMRKITSVLELVSYKKLSRKLLGPLFETLQFMLNNRSYNQYDYLLQLILSDLRTIEKRSCDEPLFRIDLLVNCLRSTDNPQTHNLALLVLSEFAEMCPEKVILNFMPIFTFMGAHVLRQDDEYTFTVIETTVQKIVPSLLLSKMQIMAIVQVFVDAVLHIPVHRRLRLFSTLVNTLGTENMHIVISLLLEKDPNDLVEFCLLLANEFPASAQIQTMASLLKLQNKVKIPVARTPFEQMLRATAAEAQSSSKQDFEKIKRPVLIFIQENLVMRAFLDKLTENVEDLVQTLVEELFTFMQQNPALQSICYRVLNKIEHMLSIDTFVNVIRKLLRNNQDSVKQEALILFNGRISSSDHVDSEHVLDILPDLHDILNRKNVSNDKMDIDSDIEQHALSTLRHLCILFGETNSHSFIDFVPALESLMALQSPGVYKCMAVFVKTLKQRLLKHLNQLISVSLVLNPFVDEFWQSLVENLAAFITPFIEKMLYLAVQLPETLLLRTIGETIDARSLVPALKSLLKEPNVKYLSVIEALVQKMPRKTLKLFVDQVLKDIYLPLLAIDTDLVAPSIARMVLLLSEEQFKPLFGFLINWATENNQLSAFFATLFNLVLMLEHLSLEYVISSIDMMLQALEKRENKDIIFKILLKTGKFNQNAFTRANELVSALVPFIKDDLGLEALISVVLNAESSWKLLTESLVAELHGESRRTALGAVGSLFERIGERFLTQLPEFVPALAECVEDPRVKDAFDVATLKIEAVLGESLSMYLEK